MAIQITRREFAALAAALRPEKTTEWISLFDRKSLDGWRAAENPGSWRVADGLLTTDGPRAHLFYVGPVQGAAFRNFELEAEVMTRPGANSGIYFHTRFVPEGWPAQGFEVQINNTHRGAGDYRERKKTASLYGVRNIYKQLVPDNEWFRMGIAVRGRQVQIRLNGRLLVDYVFPNPLPGGTFALQAHDPGSQVFFRDVRVRPLPDSVREDSEPAAQDAIDREILRLSHDNFPVVDYHVHLKGGLTIEQALANSRRTGIGYGVAANCGIGFPMSNDAGVREFIASMKGQPVFLALQGEGREWVKLVSRDAAAQFDYVFTDAMTFTDDRGKRMHIWIKDEVGEIPDAQAFMNTYLDRILGVLNREPIDIHVNPTFLPDVIAARYDELWTAERMSRVVEAAARNRIAIEINARYKLPGAAFIKLAKQAGVKFSFGTNNGDANLGRLDYCFEMVKECGLTWQDIFVPAPEGEKAVQRRM